MDPIAGDPEAIGRSPLRAISPGRAAAGGTPLARDGYVGRRAELDQLEAALLDACEGRGRLVLLAGEPGIGKTRTSDEVANRARQSQARVLAGRCYEGDGAPAYWPWVQVLRACVADRTPAALRSDLGNEAATIAQLVPEIRERLPGLPAPPPLPLDQARFALFDAVTTFLKKAAHDQPLVLVLDDLHRADPPSLLLLHFLAREIGDAGLFVLGTYRDVEVGADHPLTPLLAELCRERHYARISLRGLPDRDVRALIASQAGEGVPDAVLGAIARRTEGNPLFVKEMWRHLVQEGWVHLVGDRWQSRLAGDTLGVPEGVRQVIGRRLARRSDAAKQALTMAAVFGREFHPDVLQRFAEMEEDELLAALDEAVGAQLIEGYARPRGPGYRFSHALIQETLYGAVSQSRRQRLHRQAGEALEQVHSERLEPYLAELAHHFTQANDVAKAIEYSRQAGEAAQRIHAWEQAIQHWKVALELIEVHGGAPRDRTALVDRLDMLTQSSGIDFERGTRFLEKELAFQEAIGDRARVAAIHGRLGIRAVALSGGHFDLRRGLAHLERARAMLEEDNPDSLTLVTVYQDLSQACIYATRRETGEGYARKALALLERLDSEPRAEAFTREPRVTAAISLLYLAYFRGTAGELRAAFELLEKSWSIFDQQDYAIGGYFSSFWLAIFDLLYRRDPRSARRWLERELGKPRQASDSYPRAVMHLLLGQINVWAGEMEQARALRHGADTFLPLLRERLDRFLSDLLAAEGEWEELERRAKHGLEESLRSGDDWSRWRFAHDVGAIYLRRAQHERAERHLRICLEIGEREQMPAYIGMSAHVLMAQLLARTGRIDEARRQLALCFEVLGRGEDWGGTVGRVALAHGSVLFAERRWSEAEEALEQALALAREYGLPWDEADALHERARLHLARDAEGDRAEASLLLDAALAVYERLGARRHGELVVAEKRQHLRVEPSEQEANADAVAELAALAGNLFRQEGEYWTIAYEGASFRLRDSKGLQYIAYLLSHPGQEFHVADLMERGTSGPPRELAWPAPAGDVLDAQARGAYKQRVAELREELEEATEAGDLGRADRARHELEFVSRELAGAYGLGGRVRKAADPGERMRKAVSNRIKDAVARIREQHAPLGVHLGNAIRTGLSCSYSADRPIRLET